MNNDRDSPRTEEFQRFRHLDRPRKATGGVALTGGSRQFAVSCRTRTDDTIKIRDFFCERAYTLIELIHSLFRRWISLFGPKQFPVRRHREFCDKARDLLGNSRQPPTKTAIFAKIPCYFP
jgi:hypothetical protein